MSHAIARMIATVSSVSLSLCFLSQPVRGSIRGAGLSRISKESLVAADAIYAGRVRAIRGGGAGATTVGNTEIQGEWKAAEFVIDHVIKGPVAPAVTIEFFAADRLLRGVFLASIPMDKRCLLLLSRSGNQYRLLDPSTPVLLLAPAPLAGLDEKATESERLQAELLAATGSEEDAVVAQAVKCVAALGLADAQVITALKRLSEHEKPAIVGTALAARIQLGDATAVGPAQGLVESGGCPEGQCRQIVAALRTLTAPEYVEELRKLLTSKSVVLRRSASYALRESEAGDLLPILARALEDTDQEVQYNAIMGMARRASGDGELAPAYSMFLEDPERHVENWRRWWDANRGGPDDADQQ